MQSDLCTHMMLCDMLFDRRLRHEDFIGTELALDGRITCGMYNIRGERIKKTLSSDPYSYEPFCTYWNWYKTTDSAEYSDRLRDWDQNWFNQCSQEVFGNKSQWFDRRSPSDIQKFLSRYLRKDIVLTGIEQGCNVSNGYPIWIFYYRELATEWEKEKEE